MKLWRHCLTAGLVLMSAGSCFAEAPKVVADAMVTAPTLDGKADEWAAIAPVTVAVTPAVEGDPKAYQGKVDLQLRAAVNGDMIYILAQWPDATKDVTHKTLTWNKEKDGYEEGKDREDRMALNFPISGDFTACMLSGKSFVSDVWHWKSVRSQAAGLAEDQSNIFSVDKLEKAKEHPTRVRRSRHGPGDQSEAHRQYRRRHPPVPARQGGLRQHRRHQGGGGMGRRQVDPGDGPQA